ncbi:MAG TPA: metallophosphoesterase family protein [Leptolyngbyaceae cyanobacterium]
MSLNQEISTIGVIGDVHAEDELLDKAVLFLKSKNVEKILCVGDIVDGLGDVNKCCNILMGEDILVILGNHDRWLLKNEMRSLKDATQLNSLSKFSLSFLSSLPLTLDLSTPHGSALLCHGLGKNDMARLTPHDYGYAIEANIDLQNLISEQKYRYVINGHTHYKMVRNFGKLTIINSGTLKRDHAPGFLLIDFVQQFVQFYKFFEDFTIEDSERVNLLQSPYKIH